MFVPIDNRNLRIPYIDFFYVNIKIMDLNRCKEKIRGEFSLYKSNFDILCSRKKITVCNPGIGDYTDNEKDKRLVTKDMVKHKNSIIKIEMFKEHNLGESKYIAWMERTGIH